MTKATTRRFFFGGTVVFTLIFIGMTIHTHTTIAERTNADQLTDEVRRGLRVWMKYNCENCHTLLGEGAYYAPDLTQIVAHRGVPYLTMFMRDPSQFYSEERDGRLMSDLGLSDPEIADVIAFLDWVGKIDTNGWPPRPILVSGVAARGLPGVAGVAESDDPKSRGRALFDGAAACATCHSVEPGKILVGPSLAHAASDAAKWIGDSAYRGSAKTAEDYLREAVTDPSAFITPSDRTFAMPDGQSLMPGHYKDTLEPGQVDDLIAFLRTLE